MKEMPYYDVTEIEETLIKQIPEVIKTKDNALILDKLLKLYQDPEYQDCLSAITIIEKYLFRMFELLYFVKDYSIDYEEYFFDEKVHKEVISEAKKALDLGKAEKDYLKGVELIEKNQYEEAGKYFELAAFGGSVNGAFNYGITLCRGEGCEVDLLMGAFWYWVAACEGHSQAMYNFASAYRTGSGICCDEMNMIYWFIQSSLAGNLEATYTYASCLMRGQGLPDMAHVGRSVMLFYQRGDTENINYISKRLISNLEEYIYNRNF